jgi:DNA-binding NarL/FixJ family response regulator
MQPIRVLLVDDHPSLRAGLKSRLEHEQDMQVVGEAGNGEEALRLTAERTPHVLVLDMEMPGLSGVEVAKRLQAAAAPVRILALSAHDSEDYIVKVLDCGAAGYLTKQEPLETIISAIRGVARGEEGWLSRDVAAALVRRRRSSLQDADDPVSLLSEREREVLKLLAQGHNNQQIADELFIAESTVKKHVNNIYFKLDIKTRAEAVAWSWRHRLI